MNLSDYENRFFPVQKQIWHLWKHNPNFVKLLLGQRSGKTTLLSAAIKKCLKTTRKEPISIVNQFALSGNCHDRTDRSLIENLYSIPFGTRCKLYSNLSKIPEEPHSVFIDEFLWFNTPIKVLYPQMVSLVEQSYRVFAVSSMRYESDFDICIDGKGLEAVLPTHKVNPHYTKEILDTHTGGDHEQRNRDYFCFGKQLFQLNGELIDARTS